MLHPVLPILWLLLMAITLPRLSLAILTSLVGVACVWILCYRNGKVYCHAVWRIRWLVFYLVPVLLWSTPGRSLWPFWGAWSPTQEGLSLALRQVVQLLGFVTAWFILISEYDKDMLVVGVATLLSPIQYCGIPTQQFSIQLGRTLILLSEWIETKDDKPILNIDDLVILFSPVIGQSVSAPIVGGTLSSKDYVGILLTLLVIVFVILFL